MTRWTARLVLGALFGFFLSTAFIAEADARPGGGHSYSGGGSSRSSSSSYRSSSSSSGGGSGDAADAAAILVGMIGFVVVIGLVSRAAEKQEASDLRSAATRPAVPPELHTLRTADPAFSQIEFEDFAYHLYARAQRARGNADELAALTPYLATDVIAQLAASPQVQAVVIGSLRVVTVLAKETTNTIVVRVEANHANVPGGTTSVIELWTFARDANVKSRVPDRTRTFPCPNCNAPFQRGSSERTCAHCNTAIEAARFDWTVTGRDVSTVRYVGLTLTGTVAEVGNELTTIVSPDAFTAMQALYEADKNVLWPAFEEHVRMIYKRLNTAWNAHDLTPVRGLVTYSLLGYLQFWIDEYKRQSLFNRLDDAKIERIALAKVVRDGTYDAVTVRVFADGIDYTLDSTDQLVGGTRSSRRAYTEYWTLIRSSTRKGPIVNEPKCPNCGAPLSISDTGDCTHCKATIENGSFDWVLSKIEQDEVYSG